MVDEKTRDIIVDNENDDSTAARIARIRKDAGLSQSEFANRIMVSRAAVSKWENGAGMPSVDSCQIIAKEFGVSTDYILMTDDVKRPPRIKKYELKTKLDYIVAWLGCACPMPALAALFALLMLSGTDFPYKYEFAEYVTLPLLLFGLVGLPLAPSLPQPIRSITVTVSLYLSFIAIAIITFEFRSISTLYMSKVSDEMVLVSMGVIAAIVVILFAIGIIRSRKQKKTGDISKQTLDS